MAVAAMVPFLIAEMGFCPKQRNPTEMMAVLPNQEPITPTPLPKLGLSTNDRADRYEGSWGQGSDITKLLYAINLFSIILNKS